MLHTLNSKHLFRNEFDQSLLTRFYQDRDTAALSEFVRRHREWALRQAIRFFPDGAEDVVQVSILRLIDAKPSDSQILNPLGWWHRIIVATATDEIRSTARRREREKHAVEKLGIADRPSDIEREASRSQLLRAIRDEISTMQEGLGNSLNLRYFDELSYKEIAQLLDISVGTVSSRLSRGVDTIRSALADKGIVHPHQLPRFKGVNDDMAQSIRENIGENQQFADKWRDVWTISGRDLGRFTSHITEEGHVRVRWLEYFVHGLTPGKREYPEEAEDRWWTDYEIVVSDAQNFRWKSIRSRRGATERTLERMQSKGRDMDYLGDDCEVTQTDDGNIGVQSSRWGSYTVAATGSGPIITNPLLPLLLSRPAARTGSPWPLRFLGSAPKDEGKTRRYEWLTVPATCQYLGKRGKPLDEGHLFEFTGPNGFFMQISIWEGRDESFSGAFWPEEGYFATTEEAQARAMLFANFQ